MNKVDFTLGFVFDGHVVYDDLIRTPIPGKPELSTIYVYEDPVISKFEESTGNEVLVRWRTEKKLFSCHEMTVAIFNDNVKLSSHRNGYRPIRVYGAHQITPMRQQWFIEKMYLSLL